MDFASNNLKAREVINQVVNDPDYKKLSAIPLFSFHQIGLILLAYTLVFGGIYLHASMGVTLWIVYPIMMFGFYTAFTPLHDSTHRAVSSNKFLNDLLGTISGNLLNPFNNTPAFRYLHLTHHRYVGDEVLDPDESLVAVPTKYFPLGYIILFFYEVVWVHWLITKAWKRTPLSIRINILGLATGTLLFHLFWFLSPYWYEYLVWFYIPNRLGSAYVGYAFAHSPHPDGVERKELPFQSSFKLNASKLYTWSLWGQDHHAMHHFLPAVPWHKYFKVWDLANGAFRKEFIPEKTMFTKPDIHFREKILNSEFFEQKTVLKVSVASISKVAQGVKSFTFLPVNGEVLPEFTAGAHVNITLPSGRIRSYSLVNPTYEKNKYQIAVKLEPEGRGGSKEMHEKVSEGDIIEISPPRNNFVLYENVKKYILISGGIGITPILSMAHRLTEIEKGFELHICAKEKENIPFQYELENWTFAPNIDIHLDKNGKSSINLSKILATPDEDTLIYVCGPAGFNKWVKNTAVDMGWERDRIKQEVFSKEDTDYSEAKEFELVLNRRNRSFTIEKEMSIIDVLLFNNIKVDYSCLQGTCGTCIANVTEGKPEHRDAVLSEEEKAENKKICLCVSRAKGNRLVIDM